MNNLLIEQLLEKVTNAEFVGNRNYELKKIGSLDNVFLEDDSETIFWLADKFFDKYLQRINSKMGLLILSQESYDKLQLKPQNLIITKNPKLTFQKILDAFFSDKFTPCIEVSAYIDSSAKVGKECYIGRNVVIESNVEIGDNCYIGHNTVLLSCTKIGNNVTVGCNCSIGAAGFGYAKESSGEYIQMPHTGNVIVEDFAVIHNNVCIDKAVIGSTILKKHVKIDNLVHIAHGVVIGENSLVIAHAMIGGSTKIGDNCWIAPNAALINKIEIGNDSVIGIGAVVLKNVAPKSIMIGNPAKIKI